MTTKELLQTRAERGNARGAAAVWTEARRQVTETEQQQANSPSPLGFRLALAVAALVLVGVTAARIAGNQPDESTGVIGPAESVDIADVDESDLPDPLLIEGMELTYAETPVDISDRCADQPVGEVDPDTGAPTSGECRERSYAVYAEEPDSFDGPIVVLELHPNGTTTLRGFNLGDAGPGYEEAVVRTELDGEETWTLDPDTGLVEVARFNDTRNAQIQAGWSFDFEEGSRRVGLQAEHELGVGEWRWIARMAPSVERRPLTTGTIDVLGTTGVRLDPADQSGTEVVWSSDGRVYRMWAHDKDDDYRSLSVLPYLERLRIADRAEWAAAVNDGLTTTRIEWLQEFGDLIVFLVLVLASGILSVLKKPRLAMAVFALGWGLFTIAVWSDFGFTMFIIGVPLLVSLNQSKSGSKKPKSPPAGPPLPPPPPAGPPLPPPSAAAQ